MMEKLKLRRATLARLGVAAVAVASILGVAACGGSDSEGSKTAAGPIEPRRVLDPAAGVQEGIEPAFEDTPDGAGVDVRELVRLPPAISRRAVEEGQPADFLDLSLEPDMSGSVEAGNRRRGLEQGRVHGQDHRTPSSCSRCERATRRTSRTGTTSSPATSRSSPRTRHLGRREVEHHGRLRLPDRAGCVRAGGARVRRADHREHLRARRQRARRGADVRQRQGRRPDRVRERGDPGPGRAAWTSSTSSPTTRS